MMGTQAGFRNLCLKASGAIALAGVFSFPAVSTAFAQDTTTPPAAQQNARTDGDIQSDVASALTHDPTLQGQQVTASAAHGIVTLTGTVRTEQQRQAAETAAANVQGVSGIQNNITVAGQAGPSGQAQTADGEQAPPPPPDNEQPAPAQNGADQSQSSGMGNPPPPPPPAATAQRPPYQPQGGYGQQQPYSQGGGYGSYPPQQVSGPVTIPAGTLLQIRTIQPLDTAKLKEGDTFQATAASDVFEGNVLAIPRGALLQGTVVHVKKAGALGGSGELELQLTSVTLGGRSYPLSTDLWSSKTPNKAGYTAGNTAGGAIMGALIGGLIGRGPGAAAGAIVGGGAGMAASAATNGPREILPPEALLNFHLSSPVTVQPVSWQEAQRMAQNAPPQLVRRRVYMAPPYPYPYGYPYPYPYYRVYGW